MPAEPRAQAESLARPDPRRPGSLGLPASLKLPVPPGTRIAASALEERAEALRKRYAGRGFTVLVEAPFVVVGDEPAWQVAWHAEHTIRWAVTRLREAYFRDDPLEIVDIYLFKDDESYNRHAWLLFADTPDTPYGYYLQRHNALLMNIATGSGTLVHEIVHPFMAANFPACPAWFEEGMASLYEQCDERFWEIVGQNNWRLEGLQEAIRADVLPPFATLCATSARSFYKEDPGTNYAQARYLCHYLQERGLLRTYYRRFVEEVFVDSGGHRLLREVLGIDADAFEAEWRRHVLGQRMTPVRMGEATVAQASIVRRSRRSTTGLVMSAATVASRKTGSK
ncbi:MAG: hypothetical protein H0T76_04155 [Nannocystis sp.]|nr:hypothetical protein [Nannocystis sp.]MBA3545654.1 hypothetical protein [Nannocystis sp.]